MFKITNLSQHFKSDLILPLILLSTYIIFIIAVRGVIPTADKLVETFGGLYSQYGYEIILAAAFLESLVLVNFFVPGVVAMALGAIFASTGQIELSLVILSGSIGSIAGYTLNYILGFYGISDILNKLGYRAFLDTARSQLKSLGNRGLILGFIYPATGSIISVTAGASKLNFWKFFMVMALSVFVWLTIWGILVYLAGEVILKIITKYSLLIVVLVVASLFLVRIWKGGREK